MSISPTVSRQRAELETPFGPVAYVEAGDGPTALFVHGVFMNADLWSGQLDALGDLRRCVAIDLLAHGQSACPAAADLTMSNLADMTIAVIDALKVDAVDLVANDSGGAVAQLVAARAPARVRTLTLTNCDTDDTWPPAAFEPIREMARQGALADVLAALAADPVAGRAVLASSFERPDDLSDDFVAGCFAPFADRAQAEAVQEFVRTMDCAVTVAVRDDLARFAAPTLVVWGTGDEFFDIAGARWLEATIPGVQRVVELAGAKLFFPKERVDALNAELRTFWSNAS